jgi:peptidoglycan/xylan/chitin deacetylase (PgdA/CDA1 family)
MQSLVKDLAKKSLYSLGYYHALRSFTTRAGARLLVLMYHDILDRERSANPAELDNESPCEREFEAHLGVITRHFPILPLGEAVGRLYRGDLEKDSVALTFDDGYESVYTVAFPLLKRYQAPATVFLLTDWIGRRVPYWWPRLRSLIQHSAFDGVTPRRVAEAAGAPAGEFGGSLPGVSDRRLLAGAIERRFRDLSDEERERRLSVLERLLYPAGSEIPTPPRALTWDQVRDMSKHGIGFEPHTCSHINIRNETPERIRREIESSRRAVEDGAGVTPAGFAYPYGKDIAAYAAIETTLRGAGFAYAVTAARGVNSPRTSPFLLWRECLPNTDSRALLHRSLIVAFARAREETVAP